MFTRYSIAAAAEEIASRFSVEVLEGYKPMFNAAPTHLLPVITHDSQKGISFFYWGAPPAWANQRSLGEKIINTRIESLHEKPVLRKKMRERRCLIPVDGFYEWKRAGKKTSIPYRFIKSDKSLFALAGLWDEYEDEAGHAHHTFTVITRPADDSVLAISDRMPAILSPESEPSWLNGHEDDALLPLLEQYHPTLEHYSVSPLVNLPDRNSRVIIMPAPPADQFGNLSLFD